jgi:hypothetical protein
MINQRDPWLAARDAADARKKQAWQDAQHLARFNVYREYFLAQIVGKARNINDARMAVCLVRGLWGQMEPGR